MTQNYCFEQLQKECKEFIEDKTYVYKSCRDVSSKEEYEKGRIWLVILQKLEDSKTNETQSELINEDHAKFRADKLLVVKIINARDPEVKKEFIIIIGIVYLIHHDFLY